MNFTSTALAAPSKSQAVTCLLFVVRGACYAVEVAAVREIVQRPALTKLAQMPSYLAGAVNVRGEIVPVIDVAARLGGAPQAARAGDHIVFVEWQGRLAGLLVEAVRNVHQFQWTPLSALIDDSRSVSNPGINSASTANAAPNHGAVTSKVASASTGETVVSPPVVTPVAPSANSHCLAGVVHLGEEIVLLLNLAALLRLDEATLAPELPAELEAPIEAAETPDTLLMRARAMALGRPLIQGNGQNGLSGQGIGGEGALAVASLGGEYFGIDLDLVREFCRVGAVTPVPCCPPHIVGQMNLRGDLLTLVDVLGLLGLAPSAAPRRAPSLESRQTGGNGKPGGEVSPGESPARPLAVVIQSGDLRVGVPVDEVLDVRRIRAEEVMPVPSATGAKGEYLRGVVGWGDEVLTLLDLSKLLGRPDLVVHDEA